jgi:NADPH-dependent 2,4-dienoyl-CoA reductase/sulfur reductase-like enzyme
VLLAVRAAVSDTFIVAFRMAVDQCLTGGLGPDEMIEIARSLASTGAVDLFSVSGGTGATRLSTGYFVPGDMLPEGVYNERAIRFRREIGVPTLVAGRIVEPEMAEEVLAGGVDLVAMTRAMIADPDLPSKVADGRRHRPCIGLNDGCIGRLYTGKPMYCSVNPAVRDTSLAEVVRAAEPARIVVVGGGVAGLEAARASALRGHQVVLFERRPVLGGRARLAGLRSGRERWHRYIDWLREEAEAAGADIRTGFEANAESVLAEKPDAVIVATGSVLRPEARLPGTLPVLDVDELLEGGQAVLPDPSDGRALILDDDGGQLAPTAAEVLIAAGFEVEIATTHPAVGDLIDATQMPFVLQRLDRDGVRVKPNVTGVASSPNGATLRHLYSEADEQRDGIAIVVIAGRRRGLTTVRDELAVAAPDLPVVVVGDALSPRTLLDATAEGARAGVSVPSTDMESGSGLASAG